VGTKANVKQEATDKASSLYDKKFKGRGLAPRHAGRLKVVMAEAIQKGEKPLVAARRFFRDKGITIEDAPDTAEKKTEEKTSVKKKRKKKKNDDEEEEEEKEEREKKKPKPKLESKLEPSKMLDREILLATLAELKKAGALVSYSERANSDVSDEGLRLEIHSILSSMDEAEKKEILSRLPGEETLKLIKACGCFGIYVDMASAECSACPDQAECVRSFLGNMRDGFSVVLQKAGVSLPEPKAEEKKKLDLDRILCVLEVDTNPEKPATQLWYFVNAVLELGSAPVRDVVPIYKKYKKEGMRIETMTEAIDHLRNAGIACYPEELPSDVLAKLSDEDKEALGLS